jgi:hypothetical protein
LRRDGRSCSGSIKECDCLADDEKYGTQSDTQDRFIQHHDEKRECHDAERSDRDCEEDPG